MIRSFKTFILYFLVVYADGAAGIEQITLKGAYRFDAIITHGWENEIRSDFNLSPGLTLNTTAKYLDATQDSISGIVTLRGQIVSGLIGLQWRTLKNYLFIDAQVGIDKVVDWQVKPRGALKIEAVLPLPPNRIIQHVKLSPEGWYTHSMFNGPAIKNRIASYGYAAELGWSMGPKMAAAVNFRQEYLKPENNILNNDFTSAGLNGDLEDLDVDTDVLQDNKKTSLYSYIYRNFGKHLYIGYAFSWTDTRLDRRVLTENDLIIQSIPVGSIYSWAYYPYPTPKEMLAHILTLTLNYNVLNKVNWKSTISCPIYSQQKIRYLPVHFKYAWGGMYPQPAFDRNLYAFQTEKFTGPLTMNTEFNWNMITKVGLTLKYDYFGFPYKEWAYFTKDSYSLHTFSLSMKYRF